MLNGFFCPQRGNSPDHNPNKGQCDERFRRLGKKIVLTVQTAVEREPGERAFNNPAAWERDERPVSTKSGDLLRGQFLPSFKPISTDIGVWPLNHLYGVPERFVD